MSAHKHTPGPWAVRYDYVVQAPAYEDGRLVPVAQPYGVNCDGTDLFANARLISAAPDSLDANVMFVESMDRFCGIEPDWDDHRIYDELPSSELARAYFAARAAIAKATGEPA